MKTKNDNDGMAMFAALVDGVKPLTQDKRHFATPLKSKQEIARKEQQVQADSYFSDTYQPMLPIEGPMRWRDESINSLELTRLRRGDYQPDLLLDLHGYRQSEAKLELAALIAACVKQHSLCCCVMHGYGSGILKQQVPIWLVQHPQVSAFHQAPREWGGDAALLVLIDIGEHPHRR